eukprot:2674600-Amphidinium_carterae.1
MTMRKSGIRSVVSVKRSWIPTIHGRVVVAFTSQAFDPPLTDAALRYNIENGVTVAGSSKIKRADQEQIAMMDQIARAEP